MSRILVAMSGGVDSSVAAALLRDEGHDVIGVWMRVHDAADAYSEIRRSCCSADAAEDARRVAGQLDLPFYIMNLEREFDEGVIRPFVAAYLSGETPSPCVACNTVVKFGALLGRARHLYDCEAVATGHYARIDRDATRGTWRLLRGADAAKDQAYFLYGLRQAQLAHALFPLGALSKTQVRAIAREHGLATADKPESMEVCFVPTGDPRDALRERAGWVAVEGPVVDRTGATLGMHPGAAGFTVGQRRGVGVAVGEPRYVSQVDPRSNTITLARREDLESRSFSITDATFVAGAAPGVAFRALAQVRHRTAPVPALVTADAGDGRWTIRTDTPVWAAAPGQACVLFDEAEPSVVLGGGRIADGSAGEAGDGPGR